MNNWITDLQDPARRRLPATGRRCGAWLSATRRRRWTTGLLLGVFVLFVCPGLLGTAATAATGGHSAGSSVGSALGWTHVRDSSGVEASGYLFATDHGGVFSPGNTAMSMVLGLEFAGWKIIVITAIWLIGYALSFEWLALFAKVLTGVADALTGQIATPLMLVTAATIGAVCVAWFVVRGYYSKATVQVVTMLMVATIGPIFLAEPLADALSPHGLLAEGRDLGISVAAGLAGNGRADPAGTVATLQNTLTDNFARRPLQVWNFGHVVDSSPACRAAWSASIATGDEDVVKQAIGRCGDRAARASMDNPNFEQVGTGLLLLVAGAIMLAFGAVLAVKVIRTALDTIYHGLMSIFGFAAGGFVYGPTQTFLIRNLIDGVVAAARMTAFTIFLGVYVLILGNLFALAGDQVMVVFIVGAIVEIVAISQLRRLSASLDRGNEWLANRVALAVQGGGGGRGSGSSGGKALGMGEIGVKHSAHMGLLPALAAVSTVNNSPVSEWLTGVRSPLRLNSRMESHAQRGQWGFWGAPGVGGPGGTYARSYMKWEQYEAGAREAVRQNGGVNSFRGAAAALQGLEDVGGGTGDGWAVLRSLGFTDRNVMRHAIRSWEIVDANAAGETLADKHLGHVVAAAKRAQESANNLVNGHGTAEEAAADMATLQAAAFRFHRANPPGVSLERGAYTNEQQAFIDDYMNDPTAAKFKQLQGLADGDTQHATGMLQNVGGRDGAGRILQAIGNRHSTDVLDSVNRMIADPTDFQRMRDARRQIANAGTTDQWASGRSRTPWNSLATPNAQPPSVAWQNAWRTAMNGHVIRLLR
ncbi:hypothetical protein BJY24_007378 [Nocardia transvalensis]|uniref:TrbL/VirB6 plasmid conjugal transfer protein n=1 Tax=Nocardia transvalensis TaxID=37333 RepID=A0A7W9UMC3_9NOCA|nr:hypothetical protein [Nocardia transvalensis]MBB5918466.1 hypothetical protein [Nocardia transvalensis]